MGRHLHYVSDVIQMVLVLYFVYRKMNIIMQLLLIGANICMLFLPLHILNISPSHHFKVTLPCILHHHYIIHSVLLLHFFFFFVLFLLSFQKMGRPPCCDKSNVKRGLWTPEEDAKILAYVANHGTGNWTLVPKKAGFFQPLPSKNVKIGIMRHKISYGATLISFLELVCRA